MKYGEHSANNYSPVCVVWEITRACSMHCKHCGYGCDGALPGELTKDEALALCGALSDLGVQRVFLSGGEPTMRDDWHCIAAALHRAGVAVTLMTNGWTFSEETLQLALVAGVDTVMLSVDGLQETHDFLRRAGSFKKNMQALDSLVKAPIECQVVTTVTAASSVELPKLLHVLEMKRVPGWKIQLALPRSGVGTQSGLLMPAESVDSIISFAHAMEGKTSVEIQLDHCIGYYTHELPGICRKDCSGNSIEWQGCSAGKSTFGILHNGDIVGCTHVGGQGFIEGSIRKKSLSALWNSPASFLWNRGITKERLAGFCARCQYGRRCRGGCAAARLAGSGDIFGENKYCSYSQAFSKVSRQIETGNDIDEIVRTSIAYIEQEKYQLAELLLWRGLSRNHDNAELVQLYRFVNFMVNPGETGYLYSHQSAAK